MADSDRAALAFSGVLAVVGLVCVLVAVVALTDWRFALLVAGAVALYGAFVVSTRAQS